MNDTICSICQASVPLSLIVDHQRDQHDYGNRSLLHRLANAEPWTLHLENYDVLHEALRYADDEIDQLRAELADVKAQYGLTKAVAAQDRKAYEAERALSDELALIVERWAGHVHNSTAVLAKWREARK